MADLTFTDRMLKNTYLRRYGESCASYFNVYFVWLLRNLGDVHLSAEKNYLKLLT